MGKSYSKDISPSEQKILDIYADKNNWVPPSERIIAKIAGVHYSYIGKVRRSLFLKGYIDEMGKPFVKDEVEGRSDEQH